MIELAWKPIRIATALHNFLPEEACEEIQAMGTLAAAVRVAREYLEKDQEFSGRTPLEVFQEVGLPDDVYELGDK
ncbi:MAG TPA: hypothetical protein VMQ44_00700 [Candidatus Saccharimonadales bacterium]|nr:hypothetical protein [Candidatus Saccharimonadales bacterium]